MAPVDSDKWPQEPLPSLDALVAGTVALMTAWADPCPNANMPAADMRRLLARKVTSNLFFLLHHPQAAAPLRQSLAKAHAHWADLARPASHTDSVHTDPLHTGGLSPLAISQTIH